MATTLWRTFMGGLSLILALFAAVQYNDPDPAFWSTVYAIGAVWTGLAAFAPQLLKSQIATIFLVLSIVAAVYGVYEFWPQSDDWWRREIWWQDEDAREGMGVMLLAASVALVGGYRLLGR